MSDSFDIGPLTWVQEDINQSLDSVLGSIETLNANPQDTSGLRFSQTHLYQATGALDMVGLEGCKLFCNHLEKLAAKLEKKELETTPDILDIFTQAIQSLKHYIQALLKGAPDIPLRLFSALEPVVLAMGETIDESELFFPDTTNSAPKDVASQEFSEEDYKHFIAQQRLLYQKSLLSWMQSKEGSALSNMQEALGNVTSAQHKSAVKTMWWVASAFVETLALPEIVEDKAAKRLCRKLDQELRALAVGESKTNPQVLRDALYFIAISDTDASSVLRVKEVFSLNDVIDQETSAQVNSSLISETELAIIDKLRSTLTSLRETWEEVSNSIDFEQVATTNHHALVDLDNVLITRFVDQFDSNQALKETLSHAPVADLFSALLKASIALRDDKSKATQATLIEVATALHLLDDALEHYQHLDADTINNLIAEIGRLDAVALGLMDAQFDDARTDGLDRDTISAVVKDINASLKVVEQSLDTYFRNPNDKATLSLAPTPLKQMAAIFDMLSLPTPMHIMKASDHYIQYFQQDNYSEDQTDFELLAESLSMVGLYVNEMPNVRPESITALEGALARLNEALALTGITFVEADIAPVAPAELATKGAEQENTTDGAGHVVDKALDEELSDIYLTEAEEVLAQLAQNLQALRVNATDHDPLVEIRRSYHTLKGSGRTVGLVGQAEVAAKVETFLNGILDKDQILNVAQIKKLEEITTAFATWTAELRANNEVKVDQVYWFNQVGLLDQRDAPQTTAEALPAEVEKAYVLIGGKRKLSRELYEIFLNESMQNLSILEQDVVNLTEQKTQVPAKQARHAIHTMASNALAAEFTTMGELCRALESWLDAVVVNWLPERLTLYTNVTKTIARMWQAASELKSPRAARALIKLLTKASEKVSQDNEMAEVVDAILYEAPTANDNLEPITEQNRELEEEDAAQSKADHLTQGKEDRPSDQANATEVNPELLEMFIDEANEILPIVGTELRAWKLKPKQKQHSAALQRALHTLKGSARMAGQTDIGDIAHGLEEYVLRMTKKLPVEDDFEAMFVALDEMANFYESKEEHIANIEHAPSAAEDDSLHVARASDRKLQFLRMRADILDRLINEAGEVSIVRSRIDREMDGFKQSSHELTDSLVRLRSYLRELEIEAETQMQSRMNILKETNESFDPLEFDRFTRLQELTRMIAESVNDVGTIQTGLLTNLDKTEAALRQQTRMSRDLQQGLLGVRMLPFQQITERMQRIVRQTARELNKSVDLVIDGEAIEMDRSVLDRIGAPLEHLLRNAVAHGIETKKRRKSSGKPEKGTININVSTDNDEIHIIVSDDGAGVDLARVKQKAIDNKLLNANIDVGEDALLSVIFEPGFSTSSDVSQIAGRGVGLDVVRNDISGLGGRIDMSSEAGKGAKFDIYLPITQSVAQVLVVRAGSETYALPVAMVEQAQKMKRNDLVSAYVDGKTKWAGTEYPLYHLAKLLNHHEQALEDVPYASVILLRSGVHAVALHVDEVIGNQEVVMKAIGSQLARVPGIVGATVSGDGQIVLILNPVQIANREVLTVGNVSVKNVKAKTKKVVKKIQALVVDDSLTMRKVLGRLLAREGYDVQVAKDGMDAMELLQIRTPDIILTDIEMPRMDGFGLSRNIRDDARTKATPLIMISSRTADKHQNLAKEIGVDAFFGKPVQDEELIAKMKELLKEKK